MRPEIAAFVKAVQEILALDKLGIALTDEGERLLAHEVAQRFFDAIVAAARA